MIDRERLSPRQKTVISALEIDGEWRLSHTYGDGIANVTHNQTGAMCFIERDGTLHQPRSMETMLLQVELLNAGFTVRTPANRIAR